MLFEAYVRDVHRLLVDTNRWPLLGQSLRGTMTTRLSSLSGIALAALFPLSLSGQVICSAPHSSPTLAQGGSLSALPVGGGWAQISFYRQRSVDFFNRKGDRQDFLAQGEFLTRSVFLTAGVGVAEGLDLWAQLPVHRLGVESLGGNSVSSGVGDLRFAARVSPELFGFEAPVGLRFGAKVPGSTFPVDATVLPLTEGQRDLEISLESGRAFDFLPIYVVGWAGYRWRSLNERALYEPGDESFGHLAVGGSAYDLTWEIGADGLWGKAPIVSGLILADQEARRLLQIVPTVGYAVGPGTVEVSVQIPLAGRNLPSAVGIGVGYRTAWGLL